MINFGLYLKKVFPGKPAKTLFTSLLVFTALLFSCQFLVGQGNKTGTNHYKQASSNHTYQFSTSTGTYLHLTDSTSINNGQVWDDPPYAVPVNFGFSMFGKTIETLDFRVGEGGLLHGLSSTDSTRNPVIAPYHATLIDRGHTTGNSKSPLSYKTSGAAGNRILKIEWRNVGYYNEWDTHGTLQDSVNFQLWIYESNGDIEFHYGPSSVTDADTTMFYDDNPGPTVGLALDSIPATDPLNLHLLHGPPQNPVLNDTLTNLDAPPVNGTIYRFSKKPTGIRQLTNNTTLEIYPNPASNQIEIRTSQNDLQLTELKIYNAIGKTVYQGIQPENQLLDISFMENGVYFVHLLTPKGWVTEKFIKR